MRAGATVAAGLAAQGGSFLVELGRLEQALIVSRPSKAIKSPYVADILLVSDINPLQRGEFQDRLSELCSRHVHNEGSKKESKAEAKRKSAEQQTLIHNYLESLSSSKRHLAHAPSLDCAGMVVSGATVWMSSKSQSPSSSSPTKTAFTMQLCEELREGGHRTIVGYHPSLAEKAFRALIDQDEHFVRGQLGVEGGRSSIESVSSQKTFGNSRIDFVIETLDRVILVEVKNVVGADYIDGYVPAARSLVGVYTVPEEEGEGGGKRAVRSAIFPHGTTTKSVGVVSDRAIKHLTELTNLQGSTSTFGSSEKKVQSVVCFMVNRRDCEQFRPCHEADMLFAQCLQRAQNAGVLVLAKQLDWELEEGRCTSGKDIPVVFHPSVDCTVLDESWLARVLEYNANHGSDRSNNPTPTKQKGGTKRQRQSD